MIKLFSLKQQKKEGDGTQKSGSQKKASAAQLRIQKGIEKINILFIYFLESRLLFKI